MTGLGDRCRKWRIMTLCLWFVLQFIYVSSFRLPRMTKEVEEKVAKSLEEQHKILQHLLDNYDKRFIPAIPGHPVTVRLTLEVSDVLKLDDMEAEMIVIIRQTWNDFRLKRNSTTKSKLKVREHLLKEIWLPDIRIINLKEVKRFHGFGGVNMNIYPSGNVHYSQEALIRVDCPMKLYDFPMDRQTCVLTFASFAYSKALLRFSLGNKKTVVRPIHLPQYDFVEVKHDIEYINKTRHVLTNAKIALVFQRRAGYYILQIYVPSTFLVILSWLSFLMESSDITDRLTLLITMILSIVFLLGGINQSIPHVSYAKASDWFVIVSFGFIFLALLESMLVYRIAKMESNRRKQPKISKPKRTFLHSKTPPNKAILPQGDKEQNGPYEGVPCGENIPAVGLKRKKQWSIASFIDRICIVAFPVLFIGFTIFYRSYYAQKST